MKPLLTIFTPAYNRAELLERCRNSMLAQTDTNFIWLIVDDGSTDNTEEVVRKWMQETKQPEIRYIKKSNGGLHTAYNAAIEAIDTELSMCIDSDDWMPADAVEKVTACWNKRGSGNLAGIVGLDFDQNGQVIGDRLPEQETVNLIDLLTGKYPIKNGDRTNAVRTDLYKKFAPMPSYPKEKFFNPHYMHLQISQEYDFLVLNECLRYVEYQQDGMSSQIYRQYLNSPKSFAKTRKLYLSFPDTSAAFRLRQHIHLASSGFLDGNFKETALQDNPHKAMTMLMAPAGWMLSKLIRKKAAALTVPAAAISQQEEDA